MYDARAWPPAAPPLRQGNDMPTIDRLSRASRSAGFALALLTAAGLAGCGGGYGGAGSRAPLPSISFSVQPTTIALGQSAMLTWSANSAASCTASGAWIGSQPVSGTQTVTPSSSGTAIYTLNCASAGAYATSTEMSVTLTVTAPSAFVNTALVADLAGIARTPDAKLVNPWGVAFSPSSLAWVANNGTQTSTLYDGNGVAQPAAAPLVVALPQGAGAAGFDPSGVVFNASTTDFVVGSGASAAAAIFVFVGEGGMIAGWAPSADPTHAITMYADLGGAVYKGAAIATRDGAGFLYATDFHNGKVDVFDAHFQKQTTSATSFAFADPSLPANYAPFGIQAIDNGTGLGVVDVFDSNGVLLKQLVPAGGHLNAPWGLALAPADFGTLGGKLLVGNFGDGVINAYDPATGSYSGAIADSQGHTIAVPGLWGIAFGNDAHNQPHNTLFYAAGTNDEADGIYGRIDVGATAPALGTPPVVAVTAPTGSVSGTVTVTATATDPLGISRVEFFANGTSIGTKDTSPFSVQWDTTTIADGTVALTAKATDPDGNVATSTSASVTVANHAAATTLTQVQQTVFTPICSGCHNGSQPASGALPGSQNLAAGHSFTSLVGVASHEQPTILRVKPGDPANSYLIQKLEGTTGISGSRMPLGGPFLDQTTIDQIKSWIAAGAPND